MIRTPRRTRPAVLAACSALALGMTLSACAAGNEEPSNDASNAGATSVAGLSGTLNGAGSSAQEAAQGAWAAGFQTANPDVTVNYDPVGSGGGREQFLAGGVTFAGSDSYLEDEELAASKKVCNGSTAIEAPAYIGPIAVVYNLDGVDDLQLSPDTLASIFAGKITSWDDPAIKADNPDADLPGEKITPVHRSDDSGTTDNFTDYLHQAAGDVWTAEPDGVWPFKSGEGAAQTSGMVQAVSGGNGTIGYADLSQAGDLGVAAVKVGDTYAKPTPEAAAKVVEISPKVEGRPADDFAVEIDRTTTESGTYPIVLLSYVIACPTYADANDAELTKEFLSYVVSEEGQQAAADAAGSAPLSSTLVDTATQIVSKISKG